MPKLRSVTRNGLGQLATGIIALGLCATLSAAQTSATSAGSPHTFAASGDHFALDGKPFQILSGEMHYPRIPRAYWRARFRMARAMGLNTVTAYVFWNVHETSPGVYDFSGQNDVAEFVREAQQEGLYVLLRPGPYVCAEWEWGGYPSWLLKDPDMVVRTRDPKFLAATSRWLHRLGQELAPLQIGNGGPIIGVQVENEYGSYGDDHAYMEEIKHELLDSGFTKAMLYTADGPEQIPKGSLPELPAVINFGEGEAAGSFKILHDLRPNGPFMSGEYWDGWFDHWGGPHARTDTAKQLADVEFMLSHGYSMSIYMFHGGTSFGWMNGANVDRNRYEPDVNSYDYDSALDESGHPTPKYMAFREAIAKATHRELPPVPKAPSTQTIAPFTLTESASLLSQLPTPAATDVADPPTMESLGQAYGYVLYRTHLGQSAKGDLTLHTLHNYALVLADGKPLGELDRRTGTETLKVDLPAGTELTLLVENTGRVNFGKTLPTERVGILGGVTLAGSPLHGWDAVSLPLLHPEQQQFAAKSCEGACLYRGHFVAKAATDTWLDTRTIQKGLVWVNGHPLGHAWDVGPQRTLYLPGPWLHQGENDIVVLDLKGSGAPLLRGLDHRVDDPIAPQ
ncbi:beta-galactosidase [Bryocella elongata]|uniref:Beta-galactosidase n=1 Tax=Bryocella elongata TaxID=863522 RepID=A0A1H5TCV3_9BACT|nr:glycoside hydrolase family 35 protein [Bryocella elongata]SEF60626.1 beta-galactosidase [Bryocella elongata]